MGMDRDEQTLEPVTYYYKPLPALGQRQYVMVDPMLATGADHSGGQYAQGVGREKV